MSQTRPRSPNGTNLHRFLEEFGVRVRPYNDARSPRPANTVYGGRTVARLMQQDAERCRTVITAIQASNPRCFEDRIVLSVWDFIGAHLADRPRREIAAKFAKIDLASIQRRAQIIAAGRHARMGKTIEKLATLIADQILEKDTA